MFGRKKEASAAVDTAVAKAVSFEVTVVDLARRSERRAWRVAWCAIVMSLVLAGGYYFMLPLKERVPYLVMADAFTGQATVARLRDDFRNHSITSSEAINRSNVAHYVIARESYDFTLQTLRDWTTVYTMSTRDVAASYSNLHARNNPAAPYFTYGNTRSLRVRILSIVLIDDEAGNPVGATVRFQRSVHDKASGVTQPLDSKIATLAFNYNSNLKMDEQQRIVNPLGFQVTSYRVDNDYAAAPPLEEQVPVAPPMQANPQPFAAEPAPAPAAAPVAVGAEIPAAGAPPTGGAIAVGTTPAADRPQTANGVGTR